MADVRGASGVPEVAAFGGIRTPTPSTPVYVDLATGDLYVLVNNVVTLVGQAPTNANTIIAGQSLSQHYAAPMPNQASDILMVRAFSPRQLPAVLG